MARRVLARWGGQLGGTVLCAVSGGRDSMALLHLLSALAPETGTQVMAAHFNHQLRPLADRDEDFVRAWCGARGIPLACGRGNAGGFAAGEGLSIEDAARTLRYAFLEKAAGELGADRIATAHHREDNAETVLLHLLRGAGPQGLGGIPPIRGRIIRPLLEISRKEIDAYVERNGIPYVEDETNRDPAYTRNRLRMEVLPLLEEIAPGASGRIAAAASLLREEDGYLRREAERLLPAGEPGVLALPASLLEGQDRVLVRRMARAMARRLGVELTQRQTEAALGLRCGGFLDLPGNLCAVRTREALAFKRRQPPPPPGPLRLGEQIWGPWRVTVERREEPPAAQTPEQIVLWDAGGELTVACWDGGGRMAVENGSRTVKRLFADRGIPVERRGEHPVVLLDGRPAAVWGVAVDWTLRPKAGSPCIVVGFQRMGG